MQYSRLFDYTDCPPREPPSTTTSIAVLVIAVTASELLILGVCKILSWYADSIFYQEYSYFQEEEVEQSRETIANSLQTSKYKNDASSSESEDCPICLLEFETGDSVSHGKASCAHVFHEECLSQWLSKQSLCPCCRKDMIVTPTTFPWQQDADAFCLFVF